MKLRRLAADFLAKGIIEPLFCIGGEHAPEPSDDPRCNARSIDQALRERLGRRS